MQFINVWNSSRYFHSCIFFSRVEMKDIFNPYFGSVFRSKKNPTFFSRRLFRVADVYTSRVTNFHNYSLGVSEYFLHGKRNQNYLKIYLHFFSTHSILEEEFYHMNSKLGLSSLIYEIYGWIEEKKRRLKNINLMLSNM